MSKNVLLRDSRDETIGRAMAGAIAEEEAPGPCLTDGDMAAIVEGSLVDEERNRLMEHLSSCETCLKVFITSQRILGKKAHRQLSSRFILPSVGVAIAALLTIGINICLQGNTPDKTSVIAGKEHAPAIVEKQAAVPSPIGSLSVHGGGSASAYAPISAFDVAHNLADAGDVKSLLAAIPRDRSEVFGFSAAIPSEKSVFRIGEHAADLELFLLVDDREGAVSHLKQIVELLQNSGKKQTEVVKFKEILQKIEGGRPLQDLNNCTSSLVKIFAANDELFLYSFGVWAEGGRLAAMVGNKDYFSTNSLRYVKAGVKDMHPPPGMLKALQEIEALVQKGEFSENDFLVIKRAFEDVVAIF